MFLFFRLQRIDCAGIYCAVCPSITVWPGVGGVQVEVGDAAGARRGWGALVTCALEPSNCGEKGRKMA
jgi:hypothetical protein